jgi:hypothetical protein
MCSPCYNHAPGSATYSFVRLMVVRKAIAISLGDSEEENDTYDATTYPHVLKSLEELLDGPPRVRS